MPAAEAAALGAPEKIETAYSPAFPCVSGATVSQVCRAFAESRHASSASDLATCREASRRPPGVSRDGPAPIVRHMSGAAARRSRPSENVQRRSAGPSQSVSRIFVPSAGALTPTHNPYSGMRNSPFASASPSNRSSKFQRPHLHVWTPRGASMFTRLRWPGMSRQSPLGSSSGAAALTKTCSAFAEDKETAMAANAAKRKQRRRLRADLRCTLSKRPFGAAGLRDGAERSGGLVRPPGLEPGTH